MSLCLSQDPDNVSLWEDTGEQPSEGTGRDPCFICFEQNGRKLDLIYQGNRNGVLA